MDARLLNMFLRFYFRRRICFLQCILCRAYGAEPKAALPLSPPRWGRRGSRTAEGRPQGGGLLGRVGEERLEGRRLSQVLSWLSGFRHLLCPQPQGRMFSVSVESWGVTMFTGAEKSW